MEVREARHLGDAGLLGWTHGERMRLVLHASVGASQAKTSVPVSWGGGKSVPQEVQAGWLQGVWLLQLGQGMRAGQRRWKRQPR